MARYRLHPRFLLFLPLILPFFLNWPRHGFQGFHHQLPLLWRQLGMNNPHTVFVLEPVQLPRLLASALFIRRVTGNSIDGLTKRPINPSPLGDICAITTTLNSAIGN